jgi:hypothetical protein
VEAACVFAVNTGNSVKKTSPTVEVRFSEQQGAYERLQSNNAK